MYHKFHMRHCYSLPNDKYYDENCRYTVNYDVRAEYNTTVHGIGYAIHYVDILAIHCNNRC